MPRNDIEQMVPAELAIYKAMVEVEKFPADIRLTEAMVCLERAKSLVSETLEDWRMGGPL